MNQAADKLFWWSVVSLRICHASLEPTDISELLQVTPEIAQRPGESKIHHGDCTSAGYWCFSRRFDAPDLPSVSIHWAEDFVNSRESQFRQLLAQGFGVDIYLGIFSNVLSLGFNMPPTPTILKLQIPWGIEYFSK